MDKEGFIAAMRDALSTVKISMGDLDAGVQKMLYESSSQVTIKYDLPKPANPIPFKKPEIAAFQQIIDDIIEGNNVMLVGGAGTGKTYLAENLVAKAALGRPHLTINCSQWTSPTEIVGGQTMDGYVEGKLIEAWSNGYVLILDELPKIDPNTAGLLNDALAKTRVKDAVIFNSRRESFTKHDDFAVIATGNIYPDKESMSYGANKQDLSLLDRFSGSVHFIEKNPAIERQIVQNDMVWSICDRLRDAITELKYEAQVSLRLMMNCRDAYNLEMARFKDNGKDGVTADQGKTLKSTIDSYLSTLTEVQRKNLHVKVRYGDIFDHHQYRRIEANQILK
jgi:MoxR-like ATPase